MRPAAVFFSLCILSAQRPAGPAELEVLVTTDPNAARVDDAEVEIQRLDRWPFRQQPQGQKCKTENGRCAFRVPPGIYQVSVSKQGFFDAVDPLSARYSEQITIRPLDRFRLEVPLLPAGSLSGSVFTEDGQPVPRAFLRIRLAGFDPSRAPLQRWTYSGPKGEFVLDDLPPGRYGLFLAPPESVRFRGLKRSELTGEFTGYSVQLFHPGVEEASWVEPVEIAPGLHLQHRTVVLRRMKVYSVTGALIDSRTREPLLEASVGLRTADEFGSELFAPRQVRSDGSFEFHSLGPGAYHLLVFRRGLEVPWLVKFLITPTSQPDLLLNVPPWSPVTIDIAARNVRIGNKTRIQLEAESGTGSLAAPVRDPGPLDMGMLPPGEYRLSVESEDGLYAARALQSNVDVRKNPVRVYEGASPRVEVEFSDQSGEILGTLIDQDGEPQTRGWVVLAPADPELRARGELFRQLRVGADGAFVLPQIPTGDYRLLGIPVRPPGGFYRPEFWNSYEKHSLQLRLRGGERIPVGLPIAPRH